MVEEVIVQRVRCAQDKAASQTIEFRNFRRLSRVIGEGFDDRVEAEELGRRFLASESPASNREVLDSGVGLPLEDVVLDLIQKLFGWLVQVAHHVLEELDETRSGH